MGSMQIKAEEAELPPERRVGDGSISLRGKPSDKSKSGTWRAASFLYGDYFSSYLQTLSVDQISTAILNFRDIWF